MKRKHGLAVRRAGRIGCWLLLWALAASGQAPEPGPALAPAAAPQQPGAAGPVAPAGGDPTAEWGPPHPASAVEGVAPAQPIPGAAGPATGNASLPPAAPAAEPPRVSMIEQAWLAPATDLDARVEHTRRTALELGAWSLDAAARSLAAGEASGDALTRAAAAVELAPDLPDAHMRLAKALWLEGGAPFAAARSIVAAVSAIGRHFEASLWFMGSGLFVLAVALVAGGLIAASLAGIAVLAHAAHDLGHLLPRATPAFGRWAGLAALVALPLALGEGALGIALALLGVAGIYGGRAQRIAMLLAAAGIGIGAYPMMCYAGSALAGLPSDPVAQAALAAARGVPTPVEVERLTAFADRDPLAARGLAIHARHVGDLAGADALYQQLLASGTDDVALQNNAADAQLALGNLEGAIELYAKAARGESPIVLFNLAQAYGRAFKVEELNQTISRAQHADGELVSRLTALQSGVTGGFVADLPPARSLFWSRAIDAGAGEGLAAEFRAHFAPGWLGRNGLVFAAAAAALLVIGAGLGARIRPSRSCARCRERICRRCSSQRSSGELCDGCYTLFFEPEKTDRALRAARIAELRAREKWIGRAHALLSLAVPGAAGLFAAHPVRSWLGAFCFALAAAAIVWRGGVVPDPIVAGAAARAVFLTVAASAALLYAISVATSLASQRQE